MPATLLAMVNRIARRNRHPVRGSIVGDPLALALVDRINEATREILDQNEPFEFDVRHDEILEVKGQVEYAGLGTIANGSTLLGILTITGERTALTTPDIALKMMMTSDADYGDVPHSVSSGGLLGVDIYTLLNSWRGATTSTGDVRLIANEYVLPATVGDVLSVTHHGTPIPIKFVDKVGDLDRKLPRFLQESSAIPRAIYVGGTSVSTSESSPAIAAVTGLGLWIHPVPSVDYTLTYSFRYRHPELALDADTLVGVPDVFIDRIVDLAHLKALESRVFNDRRMARDLRRPTERSIERARSGERADPNRRLRLGSLDRKGGRHGFGVPKDPDVFHSE